MRCCVFVVLGRFALDAVRIETLLQTLDVDPLLTLVKLTLSDFEALLRCQDTLPRVLDDRLLLFDFPGQSFDLPRVVAIVEVPSIKLQGQAFVFSAKPVCLSGQLGKFVFTCRLGFGHQI